MSTTSHQAAKRGLYRDDSVASAAAVLGVSVEQVEESWRQQHLAAMSHDLANFFDAAAKLDSVRGFESEILHELAARLGTTINAANDTTPPESSEADQRAATDAEFVKFVETHDGIETVAVARHFGFTTAYTNLRLGQLYAKGLLRRSSGKHWHLATGQVHGDPQPEPSGGLTEPPLERPHGTNAVGPQVSPEPVEGPVEGPVNNEPVPSLADPLAVLDYVKHHSPTVVEFANHFGITEEQANQHLGLMIANGSVVRVGNRFEVNPEHLPELPAWQPIDTLYADLPDKQLAVMKAFRGPDQKSSHNIAEATGLGDKSTSLYYFLSELVDKHLLVARGTCPKTWQRRVLYPLSASSRGCLQDLIARCCCLTPQTADQLRQRIGNRCTTDAFRGELKRMLTMDELLDLGDGTYLSRVWPAPAEEV